MTKERHEENSEIVLFTKYWSDMIKSGIAVKAAYLYLIGAIEYCKQFYPGNVKVTLGRPKKIIRLMLKNMDLKICTELNWLWV
jgi:hypothetical protein